jgi:hypothetical protein
MKNNINNWSDVISNTFSEFWNQLINFLPKFIGAIVVMVAGWLIAKLVQTLLKKLIYKFSKNAQIQKTIKSSDKSFVDNIAITLSKFAFWIIILLFLVISTELIGWNIVSNEIGLLFRYIPKLFSGIVIIIVGFYVSRLLRELILTSFSSLNIVGAKIFSSIIFYVLITFVTIMAINQIGIETSILNQNITLIIGAVLISFALAFGFASKNIIENFIAGSYMRSNLKIGDKIKLKHIEGIVESMDATTVHIKNKKETYIVPLKELINNDFVIIND